jgi:hypothetical protein
MAMLLIVPSASIGLHAALNLVKASTFDESGHILVEKHTTTEAASDQPSTVSRTEPVEVVRHASVLYLREPRALGEDQDTASKVSQRWGHCDDLFKAIHIKYTIHEDMVIALANLHLSKERYSCIVIELEAQQVGRKSEPLTLERSPRSKRKQMSNPMQKELCKMRELVALAGSVPGVELVVVVSDHPDMVALHAPFMMPQMVIRS